MSDADEVGLEIVASDDVSVLSNLLELYVYDLSDVFLQVRLGADGRFGYEKLALFFSDPERRFPFLIRYGGQIAGFVLASRGSPVSDDPDAFDVTEFFVLKRWRHLGVGRRAAGLLWDRLPGRWTIRVSKRNVSAVPFWAEAIAAHTGSAAEEVVHPSHPDAWRVFSFHSR